MDALTIQIYVIDVYTVKPSEWERGRAANGFTKKAGKEETKEV
jgi:hypothetical protein